MSEQFQVKTGTFHGPLPLLLDLIERRKLLINDVSLAKVADDYIEYVKGLNKLPISGTASFILIASTLILLKSISLLPSLAILPEEEASIIDLERRLKLYKRVRELSVSIKDKFAERIIFRSGSRAIIKPIFSPPEDLDCSLMSKSLDNCLLNLPSKEKYKEAVIQKVISLEDMIQKLTQRIKENIELTFQDFAGNNNSQGVNKEERISVVISFLAMLELVKQDVIYVAQESIFQDIKIKKYEVI